MQKINLTEEQKDLIYEAVSKGQSLEKAGEFVGVSRRSLVRLASTDPIFEKELAQSRAIYAESLVEGLLTIADDCETMAEVQRARLDSENRRWIASKYAPKVFADNINVNVQHHLDLSSVLLAADNRVLPLLSTNSVKTIEHDASSGDSAELDQVVDITELF